MLTAACSLLPPDPFPRSALQAGLDRLVETQAASAATLRIREGEHEWAAGAGTAELASSVPVSTSARFRIGSVTKTFVATVVLQLVDEGRLALDDPIAVHLPGVVPGGEAISVRQILNHTSGIYDYAHERDWSTNRWRGEARFRTYRPQELLDVAFTQPPHFPPGQGWHYSNTNSNTNYVVAGLLVEELSGKPYGDAITERIIRPLRLNQTTVPGTDPTVPEPHAHGYTDVAGTLVDATEMNPSLDWAAGEMISTASDLNRFLFALLGGELISAGALTAMRDTVETGRLSGTGSVSSSTTCRAAPRSSDTAVSCWDSSRTRWRRRTAIGSSPSPTTRSGPRKARARPSSGSSRAGSVRPRGEPGGPSTEEGGSVDGPDRASGRAGTPEPRVQRGRAQCPPAHLRCTGAICAGRRPAHRILTRR